MQFLHTEIGSAKDNLKSPIHNWYKFTAGFSHRFVDEIINLEKLTENQDAKIFDPFAGCGTTLVSSQKAGINAVGNEGQEFMRDIITAKLGWKIDHIKFKQHLAYIWDYISDAIAEPSLSLDIHPLLTTLYSENSILILHLIRDAIENIKSRKYKIFFKLALSQTLHKVCIHPIAVPYISRNKTLKHTYDTWTCFERISTQMLDDLTDFSQHKITSKVFLHDSRLRNPNIVDNDCTTCITSPPYLNNLDYGEVSKVHTHFFGYTNNWNDITKNVRKNLVTGATTHYTETDFDLEEFKGTEFYLENRRLVNALITTSNTIKKISLQKAGKKSFDILTLLYFKDMYDVLKEIRRIVKSTGTSYLILGDSAPYGTYIPTTELLGKLSMSLGFQSYKIHKIRARGTKWKSLTYRHSIELSENVLVLK